MRRICGLPIEADADAYPRPRPADRPLPALWLAAPSLPAAMQALTVARPAPARIVIRGRAGSGRRSVLAALAAAARRTLGVIDLGAAPRQAGAIGEFLEGALRRAAVRGWIPCVEGLDHLIVDDLELRRQLTTILHAHPDPLALRLLPDTQAPLDPGYALIDLLPLDERAREVVWTDVVERHDLPPPVVTELAARYRIGPGTIERVYGDLAAAPPPADGAATTLAVDAGIRQHLESRINAVASRVTRLASWSEVVLPEDILDSLVEMTGRVRRRKTVFEEWGYDRSMSTSRGITALFSGGPGTGKTMVAGVIARDLGVDLYRVDVSRITSKWLGETEKNLANLFDAAEDGQVMLLFDEADSLFAKRTEVRTSVDRYANMEVNYLLQRLDSFEGLAILTSNFGTGDRSGVPPPPQLPRHVPVPGRGDARAALAVADPAGCAAHLRHRLRRPLAPLQALGRLHPECEPARRVPRRRGGRGAVARPPRARRGAPSSASSGSSRTRGRWTREAGVFRRAWWSSQPAAGRARTRGARRGLAKRRGAGRRARRTTVDALRGR